MEVGAVKQAFNNEVILLKKKLNQAKIQIIHKLTRKAKTLTEKKVPEKLKEKFTKKAESAVKEVLIIKKIKARDVAKFIVTHKGQLDEYLNRPTVDQDKVCARLLLHKALQDKYKFIRERFSNISIKDLLMSRQERRKIKKEARDKLKNKKKGKDANDPIQAEGNWDVENINKDDSQLNSSDDEDMGSSADENDHDESENESPSSDMVKPDALLKSNIHSNTETTESNDELESDDKTVKSNYVVMPHNDSSEFDAHSEDVTTGKFVKVVPAVSDNNIPVDNKVDIKNTMRKNIKNEAEKKHKETNKNKNLKNKILLKTFNKEKPVMVQENKVVDPFFITATGDNYMSVAEPRPPDEIKEVHKQGNRKYRRAVMFGHVPKTKIRRNDFRTQTYNSRYSKFENDNNNGSFNSNVKSNDFDKKGYHKRFDNSFDASSGGNKGKRNFNTDNLEGESKAEKLHPSWEAKKRQSGILPFQGKKIVFDEG